MYKVCIIIVSVSNDISCLRDHIVTRGVVTQLKIPHPLDWKLLGPIEGIGAMLHHPLFPYAVKILQAQPEGL